MTPAMLTLIISLVEEAIKLEPAIATELQTIFSKSNPTAADWMALKAKVQSETFASLAPDAPLS